MAKYFLNYGTHNGFDSKGVRCTFVKGDVLELNDTQVDALGDKVESYESVKVRNAELEVRANKVAEAEKKLGAAKASEQVTAEAKAKVAAEVKAMTKPAGTKAPAK